MVNMQCPQSGNECSAPASFVATPCHSVSSPCQIPRWCCIPPRHRRLSGHSGVGTTPFCRTGRCIAARLPICPWHLLRGRPVVARRHPRRTTRSDTIPARCRGVPGRHGDTDMLRSWPPVTCYRACLPLLRSAACGGRTGGRTGRWTGRWTGR